MLDRCQHGHVERSPHVRTPALLRALGAPVLRTADLRSGPKGVRHWGVRDDLPLVRDHASRGHEATALSPGPADEPSRGVRGSQRVRKRVEEVFGWLKTVGGGRKLRYCGMVRNGLWAEMALAAYNLVRLASHPAARSAPPRPRSPASIWRAACSEWRRWHSEWSPAGLPCPPLSWRMTYPGRTT